MDRDRDWCLVVLRGVAGTLFGLDSFLAPAIALLVVLYAIATWAMIMGGFEVATGIRLRRSPPARRA